MKFELCSALWTFLELHFNFQKVTHLTGGNITFLQFGTCHHHQQQQQQQQQQLFHQQQQGPML
jgi:hypothetical protein